MHNVNQAKNQDKIWMERIGIFSIIWIIATSGGVYFNSQGVLQATLIFNVILILVQQFYVWRLLVSLHKDEILVYIAVICFALLTVLANSDYASILSYARFLVALTLVLSTSVIVSSEKFAEIFTKVVVFISLISVGMFYSDFAINNAGLLPVIHFYDNIYINAFLYISLVGLENRNLGIFIEPGLFQIYINFTILLVINSGEKIKFKPLVLLVLFLALYSTNSTTGYIVGLIVVGGYVLSSFSGKSDILFLILKISAIIALMIGVLYSDFFTNNIEDKFSGSEQLSYTTRQNSTIIDLMVFSDNPIMGVGFGGYDQAAYVYRSGGLIVDSATNTFTQLAAIFGFPVLLLVLWRAFSYSRHLLIGRVTQLTILVVYVIAFLTQPFVMYPLFYIPVFFLSDKVIAYRLSLLR